MSRDEPGVDRAPLLKWPPSICSPLFDVFHFSFLEHELVLNPEKTECMILSRSPGSEDSVGTHSSQNMQMKIVSLQIFVHAAGQQTFCPQNTEPKKPNSESLWVFFLETSGVFMLGSRKMTTQSTTVSASDYGDVLNNILKPLGALLHAALRFTTGDKSLSGHLPAYLSSLLN